MSKVVYEGWMVRYGRRKIGRSFIHMRYFVLETRVLAYYKRKPQDNMIVYVLRVYNKKEKYHRITMAAFNIQEALIWKEKIEQVIDQQQDLMTANGNKVYASFQYKPGMDNGRNASSSDHESQCSPEEEEEESHRTLLRRTTIGNGLQELKLMSLPGPPESVLDWTQEVNSGLSNQNNSDQPRSCSRAMQAVGVVEATCESIFELVMSMDGMRFEWDCSFQYGSLVQEVDGHTAILYHRLQLDWFPIEHPNCGPQPGFVRAHIESIFHHLHFGLLRNYVIYDIILEIKDSNLGGTSHGTLGLREWFSQTDESHMVSRMPMMVNMSLDSVSSKKKQKIQENSIQPSPLVDQMHSASRHSVMLDDDSDEDEDYQIPELEQEAYSVKLDNSIKRADEEPSDQIDLSGFSGTLRQDDRDKSRDCWRISDGNNFRVRSKHFIYDKTKIPAGKHLMELVAVDWYKDVKRMDHVARRKGCAVQVASEKGLFSLAINLQVPGSTHYSMVFYFVTKQLVPGSLLQRFADGDDEFRNSRFKLIPSVPKIDVDIGSSTVANGVLGLVCGVITTLVVDMAFLVQANTFDELPERLIGAVRVSHVELSSAVVPMLESSPSEDETTA
ncbi:Protein ENHANCED DISEASE RESISTANCE 2 [Cocos nucifera]|uniref:Protein ENHANCED DISEASE RESISTANCE 2 n=1 Tax=Cocos nucifera TaxID=13894 RepID=A0A8K0IMV4_COCNU|nr:Protein ENHANCED DISEASE RESISTANCE 2 [Cocos nucifera]